MRSRVRSMTAMRSSVQPMAWAAISASSRSRLSSTPCTMSTTNTSAGTGSSDRTALGSAPLASASYRSERARSRAWRRLPTDISLAPSGAVDVLARPGVDLEGVALVHEQGYLHHEAGLHGGRLAGTA